MNPSGVQVSIVDRLGTRLDFQLKPGMSVAIIGTDGVGKSTAAQMLADCLNSAGIACTRHHWYRWYQAMFFVPFKVALNRRERREVAIFDRTLFDNLANWLRRCCATFGISGRRPTIRSVVAIVNALHPQFDVLIHLVAPPDAIIQRRPGTSMNELALSIEIYAEIASALGLVALDQISIASAA